MKFIKYLLPIILLGLFSTQGTYALDDSSLYSSASSQCPSELQLTENLRSGAYNGRYHSYTRGIVTQAHILQKHLNRLGFSSGKEDGKLGPISTGAIQRMQISLGTKPDGIVGPNTRAVLNNSCEQGDYPVPCGIDAPGCALPPQEGGATIKTLSASSISDNSANLRASILMNDSDESNVYFVYGTSKSRVETASRKDSFTQINESGEKLRKKFVADIYQTGSFSRNFSKLEEDEEYYFTACIDSKEETFTCSSIVKNFKTNKESSIFVDLEVQTNSVFLDNLGVRGSKGHLIFEGHVELYDATDAKAFFVYGSGVNSIDIEGQYDSYADVNTNSNIKKIFATNIDDSSSAATFIESFMPTINDLDGPRYVSACIEYEDNDNDTQLSCGNSRLFDYSDTIDNLNDQANDARVKSAISARRSGVVLYNIDNGTYNNAFPYITNFEISSGNTYSILYQSQNNTYTQYTALRSRNDLFCTDSTGYAGYTSSVLFGISCIH